ncbi:MAG: 1-acyl-sn-glycerol-3-phosphate acyltransferase [Paracoccaceae bacterium]
MTHYVEIPLWLLILILLFAVVTFASHFLFPSVRWFFRRRLEKAVARLNEKLERPIQPFKLARRHDMIQRLIYDPHVSQAIYEHAREFDVPESVAFEEARRYAREIVPGFSAFTYYGVAIRLARFLSNSLYRVRLGHIDGVALKEIDPEATIVFVMNHRSNMDYVLVTYLAADRTTLSYAVGEWARVWPLSGLIRAMGAYFIRRKSRSELYRKVLATYVRHATQAGVAQAIFPEGGLSLTGQVMPPKLGLFKYILDGFDPEQRDVVFVPVALNYDRVLEDQILTSAAKAQERRFKARIGVVAFKTLKQFWLRITGRYRRFGYAAVSFGKPVSLIDLSKESRGDLTIDLARKLMRRIGDLVPVLPVPVLSQIMLEHRMLTWTNLLTQVEKLTEKIPNSEIHMPRHEREYALEVAVRRLKDRGLIAADDGILRVAEDAEDILNFYANSIRHLIPDEITENSATAK